MQFENLSTQKRSGSVMFADVAGFTNLSEELGEELSFNLIQDVSAMMLEVVREQNGTLGEFRGDGIMALFGVTSSLEDASLSACRAAALIQRKIKSQEARLIREYGHSPKLRIGVHRGPLVVGDVGDKQTSHVAVIGDAANYASRLEALALPGDIYISDQIAEELEGLIETTDLGELSVKGKSEPQRVFRLDSIKTSVTRFEASRARGLSGLVERQQELSELSDHLQCSREGIVKIVNLVGEAGIGKSRVMHEFESQISPDEVLILRGECRANGETFPFLPFANLVRSALRIDAHTSAGVAEAKIRNSLSAMEFTDATATASMMTLIGMKQDEEAKSRLSADIVGARMRNMILDLLVHLCKRSPVLLMIEDLHWIDNGSQQIIQRISNLDEEIPLMLVCAFRPEYEAPWKGNKKVASLLLKPISNDGVTSLIVEYLGGLSNAEKIARSVAERAEGNPLFAEEIAKYLRQSASSETEEAIDTSATALPISLQNLIMEKFDRLERASQHVLQAASVIGRRFNIGIPAKIVGEENLSRAISEAISAELILPIESSDADFEFKHALVQEAVKFTLITPQYRSLNGKVAIEMEARYRHREDEISETLAHHFDQAEMFEKAAIYSAVAGKKSLNLFSLTSAKSKFERAFDLIKKHDLTIESEFLGDFFADWFEVKQWLVEFNSTISVFESNPKMFARLREHKRYGRIIGLVGVAYSQNLEFGKSKEKLLEAIRIGREHKNDEAIADGSLGLMLLHCSATEEGSLDRIEEICGTMDELFDGELPPYYKTYRHWYLSWRLALRGDMDVALERGQELTDWGRVNNYAGAVGWGSNIVSFNEAYSENFEAAIRIAEEGIHSGGGRVNQLICSGIKGFSMVVSGQVKEGSEILQRVFDIGHELDFRGVFNIVDGPIGLAKVVAGDLGGGVKWLNEATSRSLSNGNSHGAAMGHITLGQIYLQIATSKEKPSFKAILKNIVFLMTSIPFAKTKSVQHLDEAIRIGQKMSMFGVTAHALFLKSQALRTSKRVSDANDTLLKAKSEVNQIHWEMMRERIDSEIEKYGLTEHVSKVVHG